MTNDHPTTEQLQELADGMLAPAERSRVRAHLEHCGTCREESSRVQSLMAALRTLPRELDPGADLRPGILAEIQRRSVARGRRAALQTLRWPLSAAAAILIILTSTLTVMLVQSPEVSTRTEVSANFVLLEGEYLRAADEFARALDAERERLSPETLDLMEASLRSVERALAESRAALDEDPVSLALKELVLAAHRHRLDVLRRATIMMVGT